MYKKLIKVMLCISLVISMTACSENPRKGSAEIISTEPIENDVPSYTLEKIGELADTNYTTSYGILTSATDSGITLFSGNGVRFEKQYYAVNDLGNGFYSVSDSDVEINSVGLISLDGLELIPCEAALIEWMNPSMNHRFLLVYYAENVTENEDECLIYSSDRIVSLAPSDKDIMYTGYAKIYDTQNHNFINGLTITIDNQYYSKACGNSILISVGNLSQLYGADGTLLMEITGFVDVGNDYFIVSSNGEDKVYDENGLEICTDKDLNSLNSTSGLLTQFEDQNCILLDKTGNQILGESFAHIIKETNGFVEVENENGSYELWNLNNEQIAESETSFFSMNKPGYYYVQQSDGYSLIGPQGVIAENLEDSPSNACIINENTAFVIADRDFSLEFDNHNLNKLGFALISAQDKATGLYSVFDLFTGKQLLPYEFDKILSIEGYLYAYKSGNWEVYQVNLG